MWLTPLPRLARIPGGYVARSRRELVELVRAGRIPVCSPAPAVWDLLMAAPRGQETLVLVDEAPLCGLGRGLDYWPSARVAYQLGRNEGLSLMVACQYPADLEPRVQNCSEAVVSGSLPGAAAQDWLRARWGLDTPSQPLEFVYWIGGEAGSFNLEVRKQ